MAGLSYVVTGRGRGIGRAVVERLLADGAGVVAIERALGALHTMDRVGRPEEVAAAVVHLLSGDAGFINGATVPVDGGRTVLTREPQP